MPPDEDQHVVTQDVLDTIFPQEIPKPEHLFENMETKALFYSWPPLAQVTEVPKDLVDFTVCLQTDDAGLAEVWEVEVWYWLMEQEQGVAEQSSWGVSQLKQAAVAKNNRLSFLNGTSADVTPRIVFTGTILAAGALRFTIKFRSPSRHQSLIDVKDHQGIQNGFLVVKYDEVEDDDSDAGKHVASEDIDQINEVITGIPEEFRVVKVQSQSPGTQVWDVEAPAKGAVDDKCSVEELQFGKPWGGKYFRWMALVRLWKPWLAPRQGRGCEVELDKEAILCSFAENWTGRHVVVLALSGVDDVNTTIASTEFGNIALKVCNSSAVTGTARVIVSVGDSFDSANCAAMYQAREVVRGMSVATGEEQKELQELKDNVKPEWMENWFDGLTYCTWNAMGQEVTGQKILDAFKILSENGVSFTNLIIDDGWQAIDNPTGGQNQFQQGWEGFEARPQAFSGGLKIFVSQFRKLYPSVQHIAVWHALLGYWAGIAADGEISKKYKTRKVLREDNERRNLPIGGEMTVVHEDDVGRMYDDFYKFLSDCGIDAVKTDAQFMIETITSSSARASLTPAYLNAWTLASLRHFSIKAISCMSQVPSIIFRNQLPTNRPPILLRNSDDFFPHIPSSHAWHVYVNASNALLTQHLNVVPDWDMFQTVHEYSSFHAAARCVSGGPVYITDIPGQHDIKLIRQMCGTNVHGKTVIFRPSTFGKTIDPYQKYEELVLLKVGTFHGRAGTGTSILGIFNVSPRPLSEVIHLSLFPGVLEDQQYIIRSHTSGRVSKPAHVVDTGVDELVQISLEERGWDILSAYPLTGFEFEEGIDGEHTLYLADLGLVGKMTGAAAVVRSEMSRLENGRIEIRTSLKALGVWGIYISWLQFHHFATNFRDAIFISIQDRIIPYRDTVKISEGSPLVLEVNIEKAWKEMGLVAGVGNEVEVVLHVLCDAQRRRSMFDEA